MSTASPSVRSTLDGPSIPSGESTGLPMTSQWRKWAIAYMWSLIVYIHEVVAMALHWAKSPIAVCVVIWMLSQSISLLLQPTHAAICSLPFVGSLLSCPILSTGDTFANGVQVHSTSLPMWPSAASFQTDRGSASFDQFLGDAFGSAEPSLKIRKAEIASRDIAALVRVSSLAHAEILERLLRKLATEASDTARGLQKFNARLRSTFDNILVMSDCALHTGFTDVAPIPPLQMDGSDCSVAQVSGDPLSGMLELIRASMTPLVTDAENHESKLARLEDFLLTIHEFVVLEDANIFRQQLEVVDDWWTYLGWNRDILHRLRANQALLQTVATYRKQALSHVVGALETMRQMTDMVEELERKGLIPEIGGHRIPLEVRLKSIRRGVERLEERLTTMETKESGSGPTSVRLMEDRQ